MRTQFAFDVIHELAHNLHDATLVEKNEAKAEGCSSLLLDVAIEFIEKDFEITEECFLVIDDAAEDMISRKLLSKLIIIGAKITQAKNQTKRMKKFINQVSKSLEYDDREAWEINYFDYLLDSYAYIEDEIT
ncbi:MAG: hypothetical protein QME59_04735, partial [Candidatus Hydrothermarchaeota archaeon]|nr:hypothetical protein [Candidatus Hydrothermarchaeota archaeon]